MVQEDSSKTLTLADVEQLAAKTREFLTKVDANSPRITQQLARTLGVAEQIKNVASNPPKITVAVLGESGAGKSTLLNALLGVSLLPSSGNDVCTAGITRVRSAEIENYRVTVTFTNRSEWGEEIGKVANDIKGAISELDSSAVNLPQTDSLNLDLVVSRLDKERIVAVYGRESATRFFDSGDVDQLVELDQVTEALNVGERITEFDLSTGEITSALRTLLTDKDPSETGGQLWPIVQDVLIEGNFEGLPGQLELVDLPGVNDPNSAREQKTLDYLEGARFLLVAYNSVRPPTEQVGRVLRSRQLAKKLILSGREDSITFVATKSDNFDESDQIFEEYDDLSLDAKAKLFVINVRKTLNNSLRNIAGDVARDSESKEEEQRLYSSLVGSKKFVTSSRSYRSLREIEAGKKKTPPPFSSIKDTEIPALRTHLSYLAVTAGPQTLARRHRLELLDSVATLLATAKQELASTELNTAENRRQLAQIIDKASELSEQLTGNLAAVSTNELGYLQEAVSKLSESSKIEVADALQFSRRYSQAVQSLHWSTLRAACSRGGRYSSPSAGVVDLQNLVTQPIIEKLLDSWTKFFDEALAGAVTSAKREIETELLNYSEKMKELAVALSDSEIPRILNELITSARDLADQSLAVTVVRIQEALQKEQEALLAVARTAVAKFMQPDIFKAGSIRGSGSAKTMRDLLSESAGISFARSYDEARLRAKAILESSAKYLTESLEAVASGTITQIRQIETLIKPQVAEEDMFHIAELSELTVRIEEFARSLRVEEVEVVVSSTKHDALADEAVKPSKVEGSFILVDGSNLATTRLPDSKSRIGSLKVLLNARDTLTAKFPERKVKVFVDASFRHIVPETEKVPMEDLLSSGEFIQPGPKTPGKADRVILTFAQNCDSLIVSNDAYKQWEDEFPLVNTSSRFLNAVFDVDLGWQFFARA